MDCVAFWTVIFAAGSALFFSLYFIIYYQAEFYKYGVENKGDSETAVLIAAIFYALMTALFIAWSKLRDRKRVVRDTYANLPVNNHQQEAKGASFSSSNKNL